MLCLTCTHSIVRKLTNGPSEEARLVSCDLDGWYAKAIRECSRYGKVFVQPVLDPDHGTPVLPQINKFVTVDEGGSRIGIIGEGYVNVVPEPKRKGWPKGKPRKVK